MAIDITINYWAVVVAALAAMVLGALWYSPLLFGTQWMRLMKIDAKKMAQMKSDPVMKKKVNQSYALMFLGVLVTSFVLAHFVNYVQAITIVDGLLLGFWVWLGFMAPLLLGGVLWEEKPWALYFLNVSYQLVMLLIVAVILTVWR